MIIDLLSLMLGITLGFLLGFMVYAAPPDMPMLTGGHSVDEDEEEEDWTMEVHDAQSH